MQRGDKTQYSPDDWVIMKIYYPIRNSIRINVKGKTINPITILDNSSENPLLDLTEECGANKFYYKDQTLDFVLNGDKNCFPRITITNSIQLHVKFNMKIKDFF